MRRKQKDDADAGKWQEHTKKGELGEGRSEDSLVQKGELLYLRWSIADRSRRCSIIPWFSPWSVHCGGSSCRSNEMTKEWRQFRTIAENGRICFHKADLDLAKSETICVRGIYSSPEKTTLKGATLDISYPETRNITRKGSMRGKRAVLIIITWRGNGITKNDGILPIRIHPMTILWEEWRIKSQVEYTRLR